MLLDCVVIDYVLWIIPTDSALTKHLQFTKGGYVILLQSIFSTWIYLQIQIIHFVSNAGKSLDKHRQ